MGSNYNTKTEGLETPQLGWEIAGTIDATAAAADAVLGIAERKYATASVLANSVSYVLPKEINAIEMRLSFTTEGKAGVMDVWARRTNDADLTRICTLTAVCGTQVSGTSLKYAEAITVSNNLWLANVTEIAPGVNQMARVKIADMVGYHEIVVHGHTTFTEDCQVEVSGY